MKKRLAHIGIGLVWSYMVFYTAGFVALSNQVGSSHGESDHLPMTVEMTWRK
jgi:hypothetical protein